MDRSLALSRALSVGVSLLGLVSALAACGGRTVLLLESGDASAPLGSGTGTSVGSGPGTGTGTGSGPGSGTGPGTAPGTGVGSGSGSACESLASCCGQVPPEDQANCEIVVESDDASACNDAYVTFTTDGLCDDGTGVFLDAGVRAGPCGELDACCPSLPEGSQESCESIATSGNDAVCAQTLLQAHDAGFCS